MRHLLTGRVRITTRITHAHPACGNGVAWWLERRWASQAAVLAEGVLDLGGTAKPADKTLVVEKGNRAKLEAIEKFVGEVRASGFIKASIERAKLSGVDVASGKKR